MKDVQVVASSALVAAVVGALVSYVTQRSLTKQKAWLDYEFAARTRLYEAVGPLRFQLVVACRDLASRVAGHTRSQRWNLDPDDYYVHSFIYRLLRPLAIGLLIERQMSYADFSVDSQAAELLSFDGAFCRTLSGSDPLPYYEGLDWGRQTQHLFKDSLRSAASLLITQDQSGREVILGYEQFQSQHRHPLQDAALRPVAELFAKADMSLVSRPVLWVRLVGYAHLAARLVAEQGARTGVETPDVDAVALIGHVDDHQIRGHLNDYPRLFDQSLRIAPRGHRGIG